MEGRMRREDLTSPTPPAHSAEAKQTAFKDRAAGYSRYSGYSRGRGSGHKRRQYNTRSELIPEGRDLFIVQFLASGVLLLFVMFVAIVDSEGTVAIRESLKSALSKNTTVDEFAESTLSVKDKISGSAGTVLEIFGGELSANNQDTEESINNTESIGNASKTNDAKELTDVLLQTDEETVAIDQETLKQLNENADVSLKN